MKTLHLAVIGPGTFGEDGDGVSFSYFSRIRSTQSSYPSSTWKKPAY